MKDVQIEIIKGDITERDTDAIVNTANNMLLLGSGLGGAIKAKGGASIAKECTQYGTIGIGEAVVTSGGKLKARFIIHAALTEFDGHLTADRIKTALHNSLKLAKKKRFKSISIPDMGVGISRFPAEPCAEIMFTELKRFIETENRYLRRIEVILWDIESLRIFKEVYSRIFHQEEA
jgi:O-acetyl-ADP-ribose deacetylase (regulator of RNase III)